MASGFNRHQSQGWSGKLVHFSGFANFLAPQLQDIVMRSDLVVFQRNILHPNILDAIQYFQGMGKPVVVDLDDAYQMLPWSNLARQFWCEREYPTPFSEEQVSGGAMRFLEEGVRISNGLISPNRLLLQDWSHITKGRGYYLQNYAEPRWWTGVPEWVERGKAQPQSIPWRRYPDGSETAFLTHQEYKRRWRLDPERIIIGWGGSVSHYDSFWGSGIFRAAERISLRHPEVVWLICGNDRRIYEQLPVGAMQKMMQPGVPPQMWPQIVAGFDIGVAPLYGIYDQRRSWIKGIEYSLAGIPWVATEGAPYGDIADWPTCIQGPETPDFWEQALESMITNLKDKQEQAENLVGVARQSFIIDNQLPTFKACYDQILADFNGEPESLPGVMYIEVSNNG